MAQLTSIIELFRVIVIFLSIFIFIPQLFLRLTGKTGILDRVFMGIISASFILTLITHFLVLLKLFDFFSLVLVLFILFVILIKTDKEGKSLIGGIFSQSLYYIDLVDLQNKDFYRRLLKGIKFHQWISSLLKRMMQYPILAFFTVLIFLASLIVRLKYSVFHAAYPHMDMYLVLKWVKAITMNDLFYNNEIYPKGMHSVYAAVAKLTFIDPYMLIRFIGPIIGIFIVLAIYFLAYKVTDSPYAALLAMTLYGLTDTGMEFFPSQLFRQAGTMSQEFGMLMILCGLGFLIDTLKEKNYQRIYFYLACLFMSFLVHSYAAMFLVMWSVIFIITGLFYKKFTIRYLLSVSLFSVLIISLTFVPLLLGKVFGAEYHPSSISMITDIIGSKFSSLTIGQYIRDVFLPKDPYMYIVLSGIMLIPLFKILSTKKYGSHKRMLFLPITLATFASFLLFNISSLFLNMRVPELLDKGRTGPFLCLLIPILSAQIIDLFADLLTVKSMVEYHALNRNLINGAITFATVTYVGLILYLNFFPWNVFYKNVEYDAAAENYLRIKSNFYNNTRSLDWTIIGPDTQLAEVMGVGWHKDIYRFVREFSPEQLKQADFRFPIPTHNLFVYIEKKPMFSDQMIKLQDAEEPLEPEGNDVFMQYYMDGSQRAIMEAKAWALVEAYRSSHEGVSVYYEDSDLMIYKIYQKTLSNSA